MRFEVTTKGDDKLGLRSVCQRYIDDLWLPDHLTPEQAVALALDMFKRAVASELEMLSVKAGEKGT